MKMTKGMKLFWVFIAVGLVLALYSTAFENSIAWGRENYQFEKTYKDDVLDVMADGILSVIPGSTSDEVKNAMANSFSGYMITGEVCDYSQYPDDRTHIPFCLPYYSTITTTAVKDRFPVNDAYAEFYNDRLVMVSYKLNLYSSRENNGEKSSLRQMQIKDALDEKLTDAGYTKTLIPFVAAESINMSTTYGPANFKYIEDYFPGWAYCFYNFYGGYVSYIDTSMECLDMISYYLSPDGKNVIAVVPMDLAGNEDAFYTESRSVHKDDRYSEVYVISYNLDLFREVKENDLISEQNNYIPADAVENFKLIEEMGAEEFCNTYKKH